MLNDVKFEAILVGYCKTDPWECIKFVCRINGQDFDYHVGMGHTKSLEDKQGYSLGQHETKKIRDEGYTVRASKPVTKRNIVGETKDFQVSLLVKPLKLTDVLYSLFSDASGHDASFDDWCADLGFSNDSLNAKRCYDACIENYHKLKKALGNSYNDVKSEIDAMEL